MELRGLPAAPGVAIGPVWRYRHGAARGVPLPDVRAAADGREALLAVRDYRPDVVLLDIGLPGMDGYEVARCLRMEMGDSTPVLIAMTGYSRHDVNRRSQKSEFDHHLVKPADIGELRDLLTSSK